MNAPTDIIIPFRATREFPTETHMDKCVGSLRASTRNYRLIIVDDNSDEQGKAYIEGVAASFPECVLVRTYKQRWFTRVVNLGLRLVRTECCVELNSDTVLEDGWLQELYAVKEEAEKSGFPVGLVGSVYSPTDPRRFYLTQEPHFVTGHCWLLNMKAMKVMRDRRETLDCLDETKAQSIHIFSDNFLCYELNRLNWVTIISHHSKVHHEAGKSWGHQIHRIPKTLDAVEFKYA
jgi:glycosyltransferase involved in cell wall biosynthesis